MTFFKNSEPSASLRNKYRNKYATRTLEVKAEYSVAKDPLIRQRIEKSDRSDKKLGNASSIEEILPSMATNDEL